MHLATAEAQGSISTSSGCLVDLFFLEHPQHNSTGPMQSFVVIGVCQPIVGESYSEKFPYQARRFTARSDVNFGAAESAIARRLTKHLQAMTSDLVHLEFAY